MAPEDSPISSGAVFYGQPPEGMSQRVPEDGSAPVALVAGERYYLYVMADMGIPITRCLFAAP